MTKVSCFFAVGVVQRITDDAICSLVLGIFPAIIRQQSITKALEPDMKVNLDNVSLQNSNFDYPHVHLYLVCLGKMHACVD